MVTTNYGFVTLDHEYRPEFNDPNTQEYKDLSSNMKQGLENVFCKESFTDCSVQITGFRQGSVITDFSVTINTVAGQESDVVTHLESELTNLPETIGGISASPGSFSSGNSTFYYINRALLKQELSALYALKDYA